MLVIPSFAQPTLDTPGPTQPPTHPHLLPLTHGQEALWYLDRLDPVGGVYSIAVAARVENGLDPGAMTRALRDLVARHPALRASVVETAAGPRQRIDPEPRFESERVDVRDLAPEAVPERIARDAYRPFDLARGPLVRLVLYRRREGWDFLLVLHHLIADLGSFEVVARELGVLYRAHASGAAPAASPELSEPAPYEDWVEEERRRIDGEAGERLAAWWKEAVPVEPPPLALPSDRPRPAFQGYRGHTVTAHLDEETAKRLRRFARRHRASLSTVLLAAWQALLHRLSGQPELAVGVPTAGRKSRESASLVGYLVNPVVVTSRPAAGASFEELLADTRERLVVAVEHRDHPFPLLSRRLAPERDPSRPPVFQAMFVHQRVRGGSLGSFWLAHGETRLDLGGALLAPIRLPAPRTQMDVQLSSAEVREGPGAGIALELQADAALFDRSTAKRWLDAFRTLLEAAVEAPETPLAELPLLAPAERAAVLTEWPAGPPAPARALPLHRAFAARAAEVPERVALVGGGSAFTYGGLARRVARGAARLRARGAGPEVRVAVGLERSPDLVATLLAVLASGAAYVPVDPSLPETRRRLLLRDSGARLLVAREAPPEGSGDLARLAPEELFAPSVGDDAPLDEILGRFAESDPESLAYLIYTSGSTGTPKAVGIRHGSAAALIAWAAEAFAPDELERVLAATSVGFDLSVFEIFTPFAAGGAVVLAGTILDFAHLPERHRVTLVNTVPSALEELMRLRPLPPSVRAVDLAGEPLPASLAAAVHRQLPGVRLSNLYAPSESTTYSTVARVPVPEGGAGAPPIGRPLPGERAHVVDARLAPLPVGVPGELVLGGVGIARGYLGRPRVTAERFVPDPFAGGRAGGKGRGARLYRTGDVAWWLPSGELRFGGRRDDQVKVRGFRIELGEVEAALGAHPDVAQAVVAVTEGGDALRAFVLPASDARVPDGLGAWLAERLPAPLVPRSFAVVPALPRTASGKVDRRALAAEVPEPGAGPGAAAGLAAVPPRTPVEEAVAELFREVLGLPPEAPVGIHDDLFRLGGHSLLAARLAARVREVLGAELPLRSVIARPTVAGVAAAIAGRAGGAQTIPAAADPAAPPLSFAQERLWFLDRLDPGSARYNMPVGLRLRGGLDAPALAAALAGLAARHQPLRARFAVETGAGAEGGAPVQRIEPPAATIRAAALPVVDLSALPPATAAAEEERVALAEARRPLPLFGDRPLRHLLVRVRPDEHLLVLVAHHAVADGWSFRVVLPRDLEALYAGESPPRLPIAYGDFALHQRRELTGERLDALLAHWRERLAGLRPLALPADAVPAGPGTRLHAGGTVPLLVPPAVTERLRALGRRRGATLFTVLLAAYQALLARLAGTDDLAVGLPHAQRDRAEVDGLVGLFVDTLVVRAAVPGGEPFEALLDRVRRRVATAFAHSDVPFEKLVEAVGGGSPLVQAFFAFDATPAATPRLPGLAVERVDLDSGTAKFDLSLVLEEEGSALRGLFEYDARRFTRARVAAWAEELVRLLEAVADDPATLLEPVTARPAVSAAGTEGPASSAAGEDGPVAALDPENPVAALAARVWGEVLELGRPARAHESFFALGGHSLLGARVVARIAAATEVEMPVRTLFDHPRLDRFVAAVESARGGAAARSLPPVEPVFDPAAAEPYEAPASQAQHRFWFLDRMYPDSPLYDIPAAARLEGPVSAGEMVRAFERIARRHAALRTRLVESRARSGEPVQVVEPPGAGPVPCLVDLSGLPAERAAAESRRVARWDARLPFDLARAPLARVLLVRRTPLDHDLLVNLHHTIADGWSIGVLLAELSDAYGAGARRLPPLPVQYADYAVWLRERTAAGDIDRGLGFWRRELDDLPPLDLTGRGAAGPGESATASYRGGQVPVELPEPLAERVRAAARELGATPFMVLLAALQALLGRLSGQRDFGVATAIANRRRPELEGLIGLFVNTLILRADLEPEAGESPDGPPLSTLIRRARRRALAAFDHQDLPFERLVEAIEPGRDLSRPPLAQAMLVVHNDRPPSLRLPGVAVTPFHRDSGTAKLDLTLALRDRFDGGGFSGHLEYGADRIDRTAALRWVGTFRVLLEAGLASPDAGFGALPLLAPGERQQLLAEWSGAGRPWTAGAPERTLPGRVRRAAALRPDAVAVAIAGERLTYGGLLRRAEVVAARLRRLDGGGVAPEGAVGVFLSRTPSLVATLLGVLETGAAYVPLDPAYPAERVAYMIEDSGCSAVLADTATVERLPAAVRERARVLLVEELVPAGGETGAAALAARVDPRNTAYVIYTSGSTGRPKGVAIEHRSAVAFLDWAEESFAAEEMRGVVAATSVCFDLSVFEIFGTLGRGGTVLLAGSALDLPGLATAREATLVNTVPSVLAEVLRWGPLPEGVTTVALAGEPLSRDLVRRVAGGEGGRRAVRVLDLYGPSESTTYATWSDARRAGGPGGEPTIGRPVTGTRAYVVDRALRPLPSLAAGEIVLGGAGLARGYVGRPARTAESFVPDPFPPTTPRSPSHPPRPAGLGVDRGKGTPPPDPLQPTGGGRLYRTGDRAARTPDGELIYLGRGDDQVKVRGFRIELGEIEAALRALPGVEEAVAVAAGRPGSSERRLVAFVVPASGAPAPDAEELRRRLAAELPGHAVPSSIVAVEALPRTASGKVDRRSLARRAGEQSAHGARGEADAGGARAAPRDPVEEAVAEIWCELLGVDRIGIHEDFFAAGGHSLLAARLAARLRDLLGTEVALASLFRETTIATQAARVRELLAGGPAPESELAVPVPLAAEERRRGVPLAPGQERLLFLDRLQAPGPLYHLPLGLRLDGALDAPALADALAAVVARHEAFRMRVVRQESGGELQAAAEPWRPPLPVVDLAGLPWAAVDAAARAATSTWVRRPFDLGAGRLLAPLLVRLAGTAGGPRHVLVLTQHHLVTDGWSQGVLVHDLIRFYEDRLAGAGPGRRNGAAERPALQQGDVAAWQIRRLAAGDLAPAIEHWRERLAGLRSLELPTDRPRSGDRSHRGAGVGFSLPPEVTERLRSVGRARGATPFMVLLAGFQALLARWAGDDDVAVGTPVAHRDRAGLEETIAFLVDTLVLRTGLAGGPSFGETVERARSTVLDAFAHREVPFERVVEAVRPERDLGRTPLFEAFFAFQDLPAPEPRLGEARIELEPVTTGTTQFPLTLIVRPDEAGGRVVAGAAGGSSGRVEIDLDLFDPTTAQRFARQLERLLACAAVDPDRPLAALDLLAPGERHQIVVEHGRPRTRFPDAESLYGRFRRVAIERPDAVAVVVGGGTITYGELARRAAAVGAFLRANGAGTESVVAVLADRTAGTVTAFLGAHAAGAAYLPLDAEHPPARIAGSLADSGARWLLTGSGTLESLPDLPHGAPRATPVAEAIAAGAAAATPGDPAAPAAPADGALAYVIYTSGSTGKPKGVMIDQRGLARLVDAVEPTAVPGPNDAVSWFHSPAFDFSVWETWSALAHGARLVPVPRRASLAGDELLAFLERERVTILGKTPSAFQLIDELDGASPAPRLPDLRILYMGGEALVPARLTGWIERHGDERPRLFNFYGPTESVVMCTERRLTRRDLARGTASPIGAGLADAAVHLLDASARPAPIGVAGEIWSGGGALARGYLGRPGLTAERFVPDPFPPTTPRSPSLDRPRVLPDEGGGKGTPPPEPSPPIGGGRAYRTGDRARRRPDGDIEFLGRIDAQVKIRGHRVEPGEVEAMLVEHPAVAAGAVLARSAPGGGRRLVAYVVPRERAGGPLGEPELRSALGERLPAYMVPDRFVFLADMPRTASDKIDRTALPEPSSERPELDAEYQPPRSEVEDRIAAVWRDLLGLERVGIYDNFFDLGGHSLLLGRAHRRLSEGLGREIPLVELFRHTTIAGLAEYLEREAAPAEEKQAARRAEREERVDRAADRRQRLADRRRTRRTRVGVGAGAGDEEDGP